MVGRYRPGTAQVPAGCRFGSPRWVAGEVSVDLWLQIPMGIPVSATLLRRWHLRQSDVRRGIQGRGCDVGAVSSESWPRGESPYATPSPAVPGRLQVWGRRRSLVLTRLGVG